MSLYTKVGDAGSTRLPDGQMARKSDPRPTAVGELDELNCHLGMCIHTARQDQASEITDMLQPLQGELFVLGAITAAAPDAKVEIDANAVKRMEKQIDDLTARLPEQRYFILPGGSELGCRLHIARAVCRRAERAIVIFQDRQNVLPPLALQYINRLSDLLYALARAANFESGQQEVYWHG